MILSNERQKWIADMNPYLLLRLWHILPAEHRATLALGLGRMLAFSFLYLSFWHEGLKNVPMI